MNYPQILSPVLNFLHCPTPQAWIVQARDPQNLPLLLTDHLICELKAAQTALLLVRKYVADKSGADALLAWLQPYEAFAFRQGPEPDFVALHRQVSKSAMPQTDDPWGRQLIDRMVLLIKEELHHFWQVREVMQARNIPYVKITASRYAKGMLKAVRTHEPLTLIDKLICGAYIEARSCERFAALAPWLDEDLQTFYLSLCAPKRGIIRITWSWRSRFPPRTFLRACAILARWKLILSCRQTASFVFIAACQPPDKG